MAVVQKSLRIPDRILKAIERMAEDAQRDFSSVANELLEEAVKTHRCPGIAYSPKACAGGGPAWPAQAWKSGRSSRLTRALEKT